MTARFLTVLTPVHLQVRKLANASIGDEPHKHPLRVACWEPYVARPYNAFTAEQILDASRFFTPEFVFQLPSIQATLTKLVRDGAFHSEVKGGVRYYSPRLD